ncbi:MAG TPA: adenosylcobinamide-GDP ribazoletransferase [Verrucomicrobiae bacterium]|jgi:adenosylcobinamide-GDP ribazoletransferase|nr:adenosylcobinamide-GDP ribazoletransferase [Verrucomicrobiae bacterium]
MKAFLASLQFLTIFPWPRRAARSGEEIARGAAFFPVVGFLLGMVLLFADFSLRRFLPPTLLAAALVALLAVLSRGLHLDGLADTFDGLGAGGARQSMLTVMDDPRTGVFGVLAVVFVILFKIYAIEAVAERRPALLIAPVLGRWAVVLLAYRSTAAKEGLGSLLLAQMSGAPLLFATGTAFILTAAFSGMRGLAIMAFVALFALAAKSYFHQRLGGVTGDTFGAVEELSETAVLVAFAVGRG